MSGTPEGNPALSVTYYSLIEKYRIDAILEPIVAEVKRLEEVCEMFPMHLRVTVPLLDFFRRKVGWNSLTERR